MSESVRRPSFEQQVDDFAIGPVEALPVDSMIKNHKSERALTYECDGILAFYAR